MSIKTRLIDSTAPEELAQLARLRYVLDETPGMQRLKNGKGFYYSDSEGRRVRSRSIISRIDSLAIPPAWKDVWICKSANGHLQATGRDDRGRKQYIYHERWSCIANLAKFWRLRHVARFLPSLRKKVTRDLRGRDLTEKRVIAGMLTLLDLTSIRIGSEEYVRQNNSYGLATLRSRHVTVQGRKAVVRFRGKSGLRREAEIKDSRIVRLIKQLKALPGSHLFQYLNDEKKACIIDATMVNSYLDELADAPFTAKDFRTWKASALAAGILFDNLDTEKPAARKRIVNQAVATVAQELGNTKTVCRKYYIHAGLLEAYLEGSLPELFVRFKPRRRNRLSRDEQILARFLRRWEPTI